MIMNDGYGSVFARVLNEQGEELDLKLRRFTYTHSERADDISIIVAEDMSPDFVDLPDLQEGKALYLVWGYVNGDIAEKRKVYIFDTKVRFSQQGVELTLECLDKLAYSKMTSVTAANNNKSALDIAKEKAERHGLNLKLEVDPYLEAKPLTKNAQGGSEIERDNLSWDYKKITLSSNAQADAYYAAEIKLVPMGLFDDRQYRNARTAVDRDMKLGTDSYVDALKTGKEWFTTQYVEPIATEYYNNFQRIIKGYRSRSIATSEVDPRFPKMKAFPQGNLSDMQVIQNALLLAVGGPYDAVGRDDDLIIRKRDLSKPPKRSFTYQGEDGHTIQFVPEVKMKNYGASSSSVEVSMWDEMNKVFQQMNLTEKDDPDARLNEETEGYYGTKIDQQPVDTSDPYAQKKREQGKIEGKQLSELDAENKLIPSREKDWLEKEQRIDQNAKEYGKYVYRDFSTESTSFVRDDAFRTAQVDNTATTRKEILLQRVELSTEPPDTAGNKANNERKTAAMEKNPGTLVVIGDPTIMSADIITILNVGAKFSGNYYISRAEHDVDFNSGYILTLTISRNAIGIVKGGKGKSTAKQLGVDVNKGIGSQRSPGNKYVKKKKL